MSDFDADLDLSNGEDAPLPENEEISSVVAADTSIDDAISAAFEKAEGEQSGQPRDEAGRFAAKQLQDAIDANIAKDGAAAPVASQGIEAPAAWGKQNAAMFAKLPPEAQAYIAQREQQISEGFRQYEGLAEFAEATQSNGRTLRDTLNSVREIEMMVSQDPARGFEEIMRRTGYDPVKVAQTYLGLIPDHQGQTRQPGQQVDPPPVDPAIQRTIDQLQREVSGLRMQPFQQQVEAFASDPVNKHFDKLIDPIKAIIAMDKSLSLKDAYDRACWQDPHVRAELLAEQQGASRKVEQLAKSTQTAQRASRGLTPSNAAPVKAPTKAMSIDESINAAFAQYE